MFDTNSLNLYRGTSYQLPEVTVYLRGGNKHRAMTVSGLTLLLGSGATNSMIKRKHTKYYERKIRSNKVEYSTAAGM